MKTKTKGTIAIALICMLLAFALTWQLRSVTASGNVSNTTKARAEQLQAQLDSEQDKNEALLKQLLEYKDELQAFSNQAEEAGGMSRVLSQRLEQTMILSGESTVHGPGITIKLSDSDWSNTTGADENYYVIHDEDLLKVINELRNAGAEAIAINGERLTARSEIRCVGAMVNVNNNRYSAPYTIMAIGNADEMYNAMYMRQGVVDSLKIWGIQVSVSKSPELTIAGYTGGLEFKYAEPVKSEQTTNEGG